MHFRGLDLNLLVALDALLSECSVTRAAQKLHLSQSAMSCALARLRVQFGDRLLVKIGRRMTPTPHGARLAGSVRAILAQVDSTLRVQPQFDPARSTRRFVIGSSDYAVNVLLLDVQRRLDRQAPNLVVEIVPVVDHTLPALERADIDLLIFPDRYRLASCPAETLFQDRLVCVAARGNERVGQTMSLAEFCGVDHVAFQPDLGHVIAADEWLREHYGINPVVRIAMPSYSLLPLAVVGTRRVATVPARLAERYRRTLPIRIVEPTFEMPPLIEILQWHPSRSEDAGLLWLRALIREVAGELNPGAAPRTAPTRHRGLRTPRPVAERHASRR